ncbi:hypothetical protein [Halomarina pelagica]|uniref:hypothetical protein n=1 Tax=Halomarina pelagica TaxID=2961599 RepID=UPI0020C2B340|nr:hypothetical protein [Halomarina sp. BND7]
MTASDLASHEWWERYKRVVNADPEMRVRGHQHFEEDFVVDIDGDRFLVRMEGGRVEEVLPNPGLNERWAFGVRGSRTAWEEFVREVPPPFNHEIVASHYRTAVRDEPDHLELTGDNEAIFQNLRAFQRALDLMRVAHNDGGS